MSEAENNDKAQVGIDRSSARLAAVQALYEMDMTDITADSVINEFLKQRWKPSPGMQNDEEEDLPESSVEFAQELLGGVARSQSGLDNVITRYAPAWPVSQLSVIDRNILRIALFELIYTPGTPRKTAINEAVELAKVFGSDSSPRFVNGVLGSVVETTRR